MNTCPALLMSTGRPGRHGNAATCPVAEASSHDVEPVRTATTAPGVVRYVTQNNSSHIHHPYIRLSLRLFIVQELILSHLMSAVMKLEHLTRPNPLAIFIQWQQPSDLLPRPI